MIAYLVSCYLLFYPHLFLLHIFDVVNTPINTCNSLVLFMFLLKDLSVLGFFITYIYIVG